MYVHAAELLSLPLSDRVLDGTDTELINLTSYRVLDGTDTELINSTQNVDGLDDSLVLSL